MTAFSETKPRNTLRISQQDQKRVISSLCQSDMKEQKNKYLLHSQFQFTGRKIKKINSFEIYFSDVNHLEFLIKKIYRPFNTYCIHIDSKSSNKLKKEVNRLMECIQKQSKVNNIKVFSEISVVWYEDAILLADLFCTKESISI